MKIRNAEPGDIPAVLAIFNQAIRETTASWTNIEETLDDRLTWYEGRVRQGLPVLVAEGDGGQVQGFASFGPFRAREGYRFTAEHSVYVDPEVQGRGIGALLLQRLIDRARDSGFHLLVGVVDGENAASIALHRKLGFEIAGRLPEAGTKFGRWLDLVLLSKHLGPMPAPEK